MTTTINIRQIMAGLFVTIVVIAFSLTQTRTKPTSFSKPVSMTETSSIKLIYRGVPLGHPGYDDALNGIAKPVGGHSGPGMHRDGYTDSDFTSWTTDFMVAYKFATNGLYGRCNGIILVKKVDLSGVRFVDSNTLKGGDIYNEKEVLVKGMMNGAVPILVKPRLEKNAIFDLINRGLKL